MINNLGLEVKHRTDVVPAVEFHGTVGAGQAVVTLNSAESPVKGHLTGPGQDGGLAGVRTV